MGRRRLVGVVCGLVGEDDVQGHVEIEVVHFAAQFGGQLAAGEEDDAGVRGEIVAARLNQTGAGGLGTVVQREKDVVGQQPARVACLASWLHSRGSSGNGSRTASIRVRPGSPSPLYSGERGWGEGAWFTQAKTPHPQPLSPDYRGEGRPRGQTLGLPVRPSPPSCAGTPG